MFLDDGPADGESQSQAIAPGGEEGLVHLGHFYRGDSLAPIHESDLQGGFRFEVNFQTESTAFSGKTIERVHGVLNQVDQYLLNEELVPFDRGERGLDFRNQFRRSLSKQGLAEFFDVRDESGEIQGFENLRGHATVVPEAGEDFGGSGGREVDPLKLFVDSFRCDVGSFDQISTAADECGDRTDRLAEFVGEAGCHFADSFQTVDPRKLILEFLEPLASRFFLRDVGHDEEENRIGIRGIDLDGLAANDGVERSGSRRAVETGFGDFLLSNGPEEGTAGIRGGNQKIIETSANKFIGGDFEQ